MGREDCEALRGEVAAEDVQRQLRLLEDLAGLMFRLDLTGRRVEHYQQQLMAEAAATET